MPAGAVPGGAHDTFGDRKKALMHFLNAGKGEHDSSKQTVMGPVGLPCACYTRVGACESTGVNRG